MTYRGTGARGGRSRAAPRPRRSSWAEENASRPPGAQSNGTRSAPVGAARWGLKSGLSMPRPSPPPLLLLCFFPSGYLYSWSGGGSGGERGTRSRGKFGSRKGREGCLHHRRRGHAGYSCEHHTGVRLGLGRQAGCAPVASLALSQLGPPVPLQHPVFSSGGTRGQDRTRGRAVAAFTSAVSRRRRLVLVPVRSRRACLDPIRFPSAATPAPAACSSP